MPTVLKLISIAAFASKVVFGTAVFADDQGLYGEPVPADAAFIRWVDVGQNTNRAAFGRDFADAGIPDQTFTAVSTALLDGADVGAYYTIVATADGSYQTIKEPSRDDTSKVHLILLNAGEAPVSLVVPTPETDVIPATLSSEAKSRSVNPVSVALAVRSVTTGATLGEFDVALRRGQNMTFAVIGEDVIAIPSAFGPVIAQEEG